MGIEVLLVFYFNHCSFWYTRLLNTVTRTCFDGRSELLLYHQQQKYIEILAVGGTFETVFGFNIVK